METNLKVMHRDEAQDERVPPVPFFVGDTVTIPGWRGTWRVVVWRGMPQQQLGLRSTAGNETTRWVASCAVRHAVEERSQPTPSA